MSIFLQHHLCFSLPKNGPGDKHFLDKIDIFLQKDNFYECVFPARCSTCPDMWSRCGDVTSRLRSTWGSHRWQNSRAWVRSWTCEGTGIPTSIGQGPYIFPWGQGHHPFNFGAVGSLVGAATSLILVAEPLCSPLLEALVLRK